MEKEDSIVNQIKQLKKLKDEGILNESEFVIAKEKILGIKTSLSPKEETLREVYSNNSKSGLNRKANAFDVLAPIIIIVSVFALNAGVLGGAILGAVLGIMAYLVTKMTSSIGARVILFILFAIVLTFVTSLFTGAFGYSSNQDEIDEKAVNEVLDAHKRYNYCRGTGTTSYEKLANCIKSANFPVTFYSTTSCDETLNSIIQGFIDANEHCGKAGYYEEGNGEFINPNISIETYADEVAKCSAAIDKFNGPSGSWQCGQIKISY